MTDLPPIDPAALGRRLADARKARGATQEEAAEHLGCSRPTLIGIEKGTRPAKAEEVVKLAAFYGRSVHELVRPGGLQVDLQPHLRAVAQKKVGEAAIGPAIEELQRFVDDYLRLEALMSAPLATNYPPEVRLAERVDPSSLGEDAAAHERRRLGLGDQPIGDLRGILESDVGLRIFYGRELPSHVAGMFAYAADVGGCILINAKHPEERRRASMVHEYGHLIVDRHKPGIDYLAAEARKPASERFAESFAMGFLTPATSIRRHFHEVVANTGDFQVADLCRLAHLYFVSFEAMTLRLERLGLVPKGTRDHLKESRFEVRKASALLGLAARVAADEPYPERYKFLAVHAYERAEITEGELARLLRCDPVAARGIVADCLSSSDVTPEGLLETLRLDFQHSLLSDPS